MSEIWQTCLPPYDAYSVSNLGRVRRAARVLQGCADRYGYRTVLLTVRGVSKRFKVHRLVCEAFLGPPPPGHQVAHLDGQRANNAAVNLCWKSAAENNADKLLHGTHQTGEKHPRAKLTAREVSELRASGLSTRAAARRFGVSQSQAARIIAHKQWPEGVAQNQSEHSS